MICITDNSVLLLYHINYTGNIRLEDLNEGDTLGAT